MGAAKRELERKQELLATAKKIAADAGSIKACAIHEDIYIDQFDNEAALDHAGSLFAEQNDAIADFHDEEELLDTMKLALQETGMECHICAKWMAD